VGRERNAPQAAPDPPPGPDIARLRRDLGELADALMYARSDIAAIEPTGAATGRPHIKAATEALQALSWFMRERGIEPLYCDRIDGCAGDIRAVCAIPDLTAERIGAIANVLGDLESRLYAIRAALADGDQFSDLGRLPAANANASAAPRPAAIPATPKPAAIEVKTVGGGIAAFTSGALAEIEPPASCAGTQNVPPASAEATAPVAPALSAADLDRYLDARPAATDAGGTPTSPRLSHLLMAAELDRLLDAQAATETSDQPPEPVAVAAPVEAMAPVEAAPSGAVTALIEPAIPEQAAASVEAAFPRTIEVEPAPLEPEAPAVPVAPPPRRVAALAKDMFADVMALSEEERIALFT